MSGRTLRLLLVTATALCSMVVPAVANASGVYVSNGSPAAPGGKSCAQPTYGSIQEAIDSTASKINVCPGAYTEQLKIERAVKLNAVSGVGTATVAMPAAAPDSTASCDASDQIDEISICTSGTVTLTGVNVEAIVPLETCAGKLDGIFVGGGGTLKASDVAIDGASTSLNAYKGCQHGVAALIGSAAAPAEVGHATFKKVVVTGYEKNGPTVEESGSTLTMIGSTVTGEGPTPYTAQNGVEVAFGGKGAIRSSTVAANECNVGSCGATGEQAAGVLFYEAAPGSSVSTSTIEENDSGAYYSSGSTVEPGAPQVTFTRDVFTGNRYEGVDLEEGKAALKSDTINGSGRVGIDLYQTGSQQSASESSATGTSIAGQSEAAIKVESDKSPSDKNGKFVFKGTATGNGTVLLNENPEHFEVTL
jgi:parallel beta helix pectate lyase-like protein